MFSIRKCLLATGFALLVSAAPLTASVLAVPAAASEIKYVVNDIPITSYDIQRRAAFLKLQNRKGNLTAAAGDELVEQALRIAEMRRLGIRISDQAVSDAYVRFATSNKMTESQLDGVMSQTGVTKAHFKEFIRAQMGWSQATAARFRAQSGNGLSEQDVVQRMLKQGGTKPTATEYMLQQVIFVIPAGERKSSLGKRKREAEAMRARFSNCESTRQFAKGLIDVTVRDLGRKFGPELPSDWAEQIKKTKTGSATPVRETDRGVEFIGVCSSREVSDDRVAQMVFQSEGANSKESEEQGKKYIDELRENARIVKR